VSLASKVLPDNYDSIKWQLSQSPG